MSIDEKTIMRLYMKEKISDHWNPIYIYKLYIHIKDL